MHIWAGAAPGTASWKGPEQEADATLPEIGKVHVITNVTVPTLTVVRPPAGKANGAAMLILPGGAFRALAWDLDGTETAQWLSRQGITAFILRYRVRPPTATPPASESFDQFARRTEPQRAIAVADAKQAMRVIRSHTRVYGVAPDRVGVIGFSAGAVTAMSLAVEPDASVRPNLAASLYGALVADGVVPAGSPPVFVAAAQDDPQVPPAKSTDIFERWTRAGLPAELHLYEKGGHGFGFRTHHAPVDNWPLAFKAWLSVRGYAPRP